MGYYLTERPWTNPGMVIVDDREQDDEDDDEDSY
jgi:hypothetical protein